MSEQHESITEAGNPRKPTGEAGKIMLERMTGTHRGVTEWALGFFDFKEDDTVLDIGCGAGGALKVMAERITTGALYGVDYSDVSVELSSKNNAENISAGKMKIIKASVEKLPFEDNTFDKIITIESFYFWGEPERDLKEVLRVLKKGGKLLIAADVYGDAELSDESIKSIEKYELFNPTRSEFKELLRNAGFEYAEIHTCEGTTWICAEGRK